MGDISNTQFFKAVQEEKKLEVSQVLEQVYVAPEAAGCRSGKANLIMEI